MKIGFKRVFISEQLIFGFLVGAVFGIFSCQNLHCHNLATRDVRQIQKLKEDLRMWADHNHQIITAGKKLQSLADVTRHEALPKTGEEDNNRKSVPRDESGLRKDGTRVADRLAGQVRILCWVMTQPANLEIRARHIQVTWGQKCDKLLFFSSVTNDTFPTIGLNTSEGRDQLTQKYVRGFKYVHDHYLDDYDWFMRTDDDAYVVMENLRYLLSEQDPNGTLYFGRHFRTIVPGGYMSGGPGIILGKEALKRIGKHIQDEEICPQKGSAADAKLGLCLNKFGISVGNTTDLLGKSRFHCFRPANHILGNYPEWFYKYDTNWAKWGISSLSRHPIGFHYVDKQQIYEIEYFLYHAKPYGFNLVDQDVNLPLSRSKAHLPD